jgi:hypothetical protein
MGTTTLQRDSNYPQLEKIEFLDYRLNKSFGTAERGGKSSILLTVCINPSFGNFKKRRERKKKKEKKEAEAKEKKKRRRINYKPKDENQP